MKKLLRISVYYYNSHYALYIYKLNLATVLKGYPKSPFSIATTPIWVLRKILLLSLDCFT